MARKQVINDVEYWENNKGHLVAVDSVAEREKQKDALVEVIVDEARKVRGQLMGFRETVFELVYEYLDNLRKEYGIEPKGKSGNKHQGNLTFIDYSGGYKVQIRIVKKISFDEHLQLAKEVFDGCVNRWSKGADQNVLTLVHGAFDVDSEGKVNSSRLLELRKIEIEDEEWNKMIEMINRSITTESTKKGILVYQKNEEGGWKGIPLSLSGL